MKFAQFIKMSLNMTIYYHNNYIKGNSIGEEEVYIEYTMDNREVYVCILYVKDTPDQKYVVSYDKKTKQTSSYLAKNIDHLVDNKKKEEVHQ